MRCAIALALCVTTAGAAGADPAPARPAPARGPCADGARYRIARSPRGAKPIAIAAPDRTMIYGELAFTDLNGDGRQDVVLASACIRRPSDSVRSHRVYTSCGPAADGVEELALIFEEEELCTRAVKLEPQASQTEASGASWRDLQLIRTLPGPRCEQTTQALRFDGAQYQSGPRTTRPCPKP
jgi:hypothetical protein